jgi:hypothetical protein
VLLPGVSASCDEDVPASSIAPRVTAGSGMGRRSCRPIVRSPCGVLADRGLARTFGAHQRRIGSLNSSTPVRLAFAPAVSDDASVAGATWLEVSTTPSIMPPPGLMDCTGVCGGWVNGNLHSNESGVAVQSRLRL